MIVIVMGDRGNGKWVGGGGWLGLLPNRNSIFTGWDGLNRLELIDGLPCLPTCPGVCLY